MLHIELSSYRTSGFTVSSHNSDVADNDLLKHLLRKEFGDANVVPVSNFNTLALKSLVKDISRFYSVPFEEVNAATKGVEAEVKRATLKAGDDKNVFVLRYEDALKHSPKFKAFIERYPQVGEHIAILFEQNKSIGRHAGGVVIGDEIHKRMPVIRVRGEKQTSWTEGLHYRHLESVGGLLKYDLLGLKTLRIIQRTIELIVAEKNNNVGWIMLELAGKQFNMISTTQVITKNRGVITAKEVVADDDITEVVGIWKEI